MEVDASRPPADPETTNSDHDRGRGGRRKRPRRKRKKGQPNSQPADEITSGPPEENGHNARTENGSQPLEIRPSATRGSSRGRGRRGGRGRGRGRGRRQRTGGDNDADHPIGGTANGNQLVDTAIEGYGQLDDESGFNLISSALESGGRRRKRRGGKNRGRGRRGRGRGAYNNRSDGVRRAIIDSESSSCSSVDSDIAADYVRNLLDAQEESRDDDDEDDSDDGAFMKEILDDVEERCKKKKLAEAEEEIEPEKSAAVTKEELANLDEDVVENLCAYGAPSKYSKEEMDLIWSGNLANYNDVIFRGAKPIAKLPGTQSKQSAYDKKGRPIKSLYGKRVAEENKGFHMLRKMGWKQGDGLGANAEGRTEPVSVDLQRGTRGLGLDPKGK